MGLLWVKASSSLGQPVVPEMPRAGREMGSISGFCAPSSVDFRGEKETRATIVVLIAN